MAKGLLGVKKDPKNPTLYFLQGDEWPSDDSNDSDYTTSATKPKKKAKLSRKSQKHQQEKKSNDKGELTAIIESSESGNIILKCRKVYKSMENHKATKNVVKGKRKIGRNAETGDDLEAKPKVKRKRKKKLTESDVESVTPSAVFTASDKTISAEGELNAANSNGHCGHWGNGISYDVLLKIFKYVVSSDGALPFLHRASKVCCLWSKVAQHPSLWTQLDLSNPLIRLTEFDFLQLCEDQQLKNLRQLNLSGWEAKFSIRVIKAVADYCPMLSSINLSRCEQVTGTVIKLLADKCPNLKSISLSQMPHSTSADSPVACIALRYLMSKCGAKLSRLNLSGNIIRGASGFVPIFAESCPELRSFDLSDISANDRGIIPINIEKLQNGCSKLQKLRLTNVMMRLVNVPLSEQAASSGFPELEELSIAKVNDNFYQGLDNSSIERILKSSHKLKVLDIRRCSNITASGIVRIQAWDLEQLHMSQCTGAMTPDLELVIQKWYHSLMVVDFSWNNQAGDSLDLAVKSLAGITTNPKLLSLNLCGSAVSFEPVKNMLCNCPSLNELNLQSCRGLPRGLKRLYAGEELEKFREDVTALKNVDTNDV
ncbi:hypothetical protein CHUAL_009599 [Chamberlinius hualienensis]